MYKEFEKHLKKEPCYEFRTNVNLSDQCWYRIGGPADYLVYPKNNQQLSELVSTCCRLEISYFVMGSGANLLVNDSGFRGAVIKLAGDFEKIELEGNILTAGAGVKLEKLIIFCEENGLSGLAELSGIPGTVGGALTMNSGTDKGVIGDVVKEVEVLNDALKFVTLKKDEIGFDYRSAPLLQDKIIVGCKLEMKTGDTALLREIRSNQLRLRKANQPLECPSCGSVFKRPPGNYAGKLIEEAGLKGFRYGNAQISPKHAGFIVNLGNARASDVKYLMDKIQTDVYSKFGVQLEPEVRLLGF